MGLLGMIGNFRHALRPWTPRHKCALRMVHPTAPTSRVQEFAMRPIVVSQDQVNATITKPFAVGQFAISGGARRGAQMSRRDTENPPTRNLGKPRNPSHWASIAA